MIQGRQLWLNLEPTLKIVMNPNPEGLREATAFEASQEK